MRSSQLNAKEEKGTIIEMSNARKNAKRSESVKQADIREDAKTSEQTEQGALTLEIKELVQESIAEALEANRTRKRDTRSAVIEGVAAIALIVGGAFSVYTFFDSKFAAIDEKLAACVTTEQFEKEMSEINEELDKINETLYGDGSDTKPGLIRKVDSIENLLGTNSIVAASDVISSVDGVSKEPNSVDEVGSSISADTCIGTDANGNVYLAEELINETILLTYTEDDKEIYFLGQYNEEYKWNGYCVTNAYYTDGTLYGICESNFDSGKRLDYKSFVLTDEDEWIYSDKVCGDEGNGGVNVLYSLQYDKIKNFTSTNVRVTDMLYTEKFIETVQPRMMKYYSGATSDGKYNDDSGEAYEIIYNEDGTVRTLYVGQFRGGTFNDGTGAAWDIADAGEYGYVYNVGVFQDGHMVGGSSEPVTTERIEEVVANYEFGCPLTWQNEE